MPGLNPLLIVPYDFLIGADIFYQYLLIILVHRPSGMNACMGETKAHRPPSKGTVNVISGIGAVRRPQRQSVGIYAKPPVSR